VSTTAILPADTMFNVELGLGTFSGWSAAFCRSVLITDLCSLPTPTVAAAAPALPAIYSGSKVGAPESHLSSLPDARSSTCTWTWGLPAPEFVNSKLAIAKFTLWLVFPKGR
jgi:hypothetical protein